MNTQFKIFIIALFTLALTACGGGGSGDSPAPTTYTIGGTVSGLSGSGLVLQNNSGDNLAISGDGAYAFSTALNDAESYSVSVFTQPGTPNQNCTTANASGTVSAANINNINITCVSSSANTVYVFPSAISNVVKQTVRIHTEGLVSAASQVRIQPSAGGALTTLSFVLHPDTFNVITATIPASLSAGSWTVYVSDSTGLESVLLDGLNIEDNLFLNLTSISKSSISNTINNDVDIVATGLSQGSQVYIQSGTGTAINLENKYFIDSTLIRATIPSGTPTGTYNLIVVAASGEVGLLADILTVNSTNAPVIKNIFPTSLANNLAAAIVTINGENFNTTTDPSIELQCRDTFNAIVNLSGSNITVTSASLVTVSFDTTTLAAPQSCHVLLTNSVSIIAQSSSLSILPASLNPGSWTSMPSLNTARNSPSLVKGEISSDKQFLYAISGDDTNKANAFNSVESSALNLFDDLNVWQTETQLLSSPATSSGAVNIGRFIYLAGGNDGTGVTNAVHRSMILSLEDAPDITDQYISFNSSSAGGLSAGTYYYRVSATFPGTYASNPSGESAVGRTIEIMTPLYTGTEVTLSWETIAGAAGYRIYRSPNANDVFSNLELVATTTGGSSTQFTDTGITTTASPIYYEGNLGKWHSVAALNTARESHAVAVSPDPDTANQFFIYVIGGRDTNGNYLNDYEYTTVSVADEITQSVSAWTAVASAFTNARAEHKAWLVDGNNSSSVTDGEYWIYTGPGIDGIGAVTDVDAFQVSNTGALSAATVVGSVTGNYQGYGVASGTENLYLYSGGAGSATTNGKAAAVCSTVSASCQTWNSTSNSLNIARIFSGSTQTGANMFIAGGTDSAAAASITVERAIK